MKGSILSLLLAFGVLLAAAYFSSRTLGSINLENQNDKSSNESSSSSQNVAGESTEVVDCSGEITPSVTEGPYYIANSPEETDISEPGTKGEQLTLTGYVLDQNCNPLANAWIDFWQADGDGNYDNNGYNLRGHQYTDLEGRYELLTVIPAEYENRTPHIHLKVAKNNQTPLINTQLFIPGLDSNKNDSIYNDDLEIQLEDSESGMIGKFNFVVD